MHRTFPHAILTLVTLGAVAAAAPARAQQDAFDRAAEHYAQLRTVRASFEQTLVNPLTGTTLTARGDYQQRMPGRLSVRFTDPNGDRIVADGKVVWVYLPSTAPGQVIRLTSRQNAGSVDLVSQFFSSPRTRYTVTEMAPDSAAPGLRRYELVPREPMTFSRATVWIDTTDATLRQFEVTETSGLVRRIRITRLALDVAVDEDAFRFVPPKGVRILDEGRLTGTEP